ncbi:endolytic transglycosylase MltG [Candidatus Saccharibacteria bacterium]|nr:endolytic transglycosylase MltG [Candidatus Saccharibacteria bacterium]
MKTSYATGTVRKRHWPKNLLIIGAVLLAVIIITVLVIRRTYELNLRPLGTSSETQQITVPNGATVEEIAKLLEDAKLIRAAWAFEWYVRTNDGLEALQAGSYPFNPSQSISEIVSVLTDGKVSTDLITILPGKRIDEIRDTLINYGFDEDKVDAALDPAAYADHPALVDKPVGANLEGYLYPESFQKTNTTEPTEIIKASLDEMQKRLTPDVRAGITRQGLTVYQGLILASIIEQEVSTADDKPVVAQVFLKRIKSNIQLGSDVTAFYGAIIDGVTLAKDPAKAAAVAIAHSSPYNTRMNQGLPPGPISNFGEQSLQAIINPAQTDYLFFVAGDPDEQGRPGKTYFSNTIEEHEALTRTHCKILCN